MNILCCDRFQVESLSSVHVYEIWKNISRQGHNVTFLKADPPTCTTEIDVKPRPSPWKHIKNGLRSLPMYSLFKGEILVMWLLWHEVSLFLSAFALVMRNRGKFHVVYRRHNPFNSEYFLAKLFGMPLVKEVNGIVADEADIGERGDTVSVRILSMLEKYNIPRADKIIVVTSRLKEVLHNDFNVPQNKIVVIWNGANTDLFSPMDSTEAKDKLGLPKDNSYVCFTGSLSQWQGVEYLVQSAPLILAECPDTRFLIVGDGAMRGKLSALAEQIGVTDRFIFSGLIPYEHVPLYINASEVCVAPFVAKRNERIGLSPLKLCEYLACQKPVVVSAISGLEIVETSHAGILVPPEEPQELAAAIIRLLRDPELRKHMGENGRQYVVENRSWSSVARKVAEVCQQTVQERRDKGQKTKEL